MKSKKVKQFQQDFLDDHGFIFCELCGISQSFAFSVHHIMFKSQIPKHPELDNYKNLIMLCSDCHKLLHSNPEENNKLKEERGLYELYNI